MTSNAIGCTQGMGQHLAKLAANDPTLTGIRGFLKVGLNTVKNVLKVNSHCLSLMRMSSLVPNCSRLSIRFVLKQCQAIFLSLLSQNLPGAMVPQNHPSHRGVHPGLGIRGFLPQHFSLFACRLLVESDARGHRYMY